MIRRAYNPVVVTATAKAAENNDFDLYVVNDILDSSVTVTISVELVPWIADGRKRSLWTSESTVVSADSSLGVYETAIDSALSTFDCTRQTCYVKTTSSAVVDSTGATLDLYPSFTFLSYVKDAVLVTPSAIVIGNINSVSDTEISFTVSVDATSPFLFLELQDATSEKSTSTSGVFGSNAGWFSDNNFVAEANVVYSLTYTSYKSGLDVKSFQSRIQGRVLQSAYSCDAASVVIA